MTLVAWAVVDKDGRLVEPSCDGQLYVYHYESAAIQYGAPTDGERVVRVEVKIKRVEVTIKEGVNGSRRNHFGLRQVSVSSMALLGR